MVMSHPSRIRNTSEEERRRYNEAYEKKVDGAYSSKFFLKTNYKPTKDPDFVRIDTRKLKVNPPSYIEVFAAEIIPCDSTSNKCLVMVKVDSIEKDMARIEFSLSLGPSIFYAPLSELVAVQEKEIPIKAFSSLEEALKNI